MIIYSGTCLCMCMHNVYMKIVYRSLMGHSVSNKQEFWVTSWILTKLILFVVPMVLTTHTNF